ncbi:hypothetical protein OUZ56_005467 [Daphnia magna]|uniref:Uncharacterized protein n=1 Tax=Daphnia magna TaxID=35525 RepID=A0ABQ9YSV6_9CRUS|nr:hypothetical protein OUZ56_005467 [Daphnia magna]
MPYGITLQGKPSDCDAGDQCSIPDKELQNIWYLYNILRLNMLMMIPIYREMFMPTFKPHSTTNVNNIFNVTFKKVKKCLNTKLQEIWKKQALSSVLCT